VASPSSANPSDELRPSVSLSIRAAIRLFVDAGSAQARELLVGRVVGVEGHAGARAPSYLLKIDLGSRGHVQASIVRGTYEGDELKGTQVVVALRGDEALVLGARSHAAGLVLLRPDRDVEDGTIVA
jgi:hypothetical protein